MPTCHFTSRDSWKRELANHTENVAKEQKVTGLEVILLEKKVLK